MFSCKEAARLSSEAMERKLSFWERLSLRFHLAMCRLCSGHAADLKKIREAARKLGKKTQGDEDFSDIALSDDARRRIKELLGNMDMDR